MYAPMHSMQRERHLKWYTQFCVVAFFFVGSVRFVIVVVFFNEYFYIPVPVYQKFSVNCKYFSIAFPVFYVTIYRFEALQIEREPEDARNVAFILFHSISFGFILLNFMDNISCNHIYSHSLAWA